MRILLVEDDRGLGGAVRAGLQQKDFVVDWVTNAEDAEVALGGADCPFSALVLDLGLPGISGLDLVRRMRRRGVGVPVLILTARDAVEDRVKGLDSGGDDYLVKPFSMDELGARIRALVRRSHGRAAEVLTSGEVSLEPAAHRVTLKGIPVEISPKEFAILMELMENSGKVLSRDKLEERLYGWNEEVGSNAVEVHVHHLRRKLGTDFIKTVRGVGYLVAEDGV